jgi:transposase-like protein
MAPREETTELVQVWQEAGEAGDDPIRALMQVLLQGLLEKEVTAHVGAEPYERTEGRRGRRNGYKPRSLKTRVGTLDLLVPQDREGRFRAGWCGSGGIPKTAATLFQRHNCIKDKDLRNSPTKN